MSDEEKSNMEHSVEEGVDSNGSFEDLPPYRSRIFLEKEERVKRPGSFWKRPPTKVYASNFGFGVNGYQPMIDYLDSKDIGESANKKDVHLPYSEERCMNKYSASKPFKLYSNNDIDKYIAKGEKIRTQIRQNDAAGASNVLRRTHTNWSMTKKYVQLVKNSYVVDFRKHHPSDLDSNSLEHTRSKSDCFIAVPKLTYRVLGVIPENYSVNDMDTSALFGTYIRKRLDHDNTMAQRRDRLQALDDQYEESIQKLANTVDRMRQRDRSLPPKIVSPQGNVYTSDEMLRVADDLIYSNRLKRQQDLHRLQNSVDTLTDSSRKYRTYSPRNPLQFLGDEVCGFNTAAMALAKSNAIRAAIATRSAAGLMDFSDDKIDRRIQDIRRRNETMEAIDSISYLPETRRRVVNHECVISDVQDRVMNRARELTGETSETRRIRNRAKFMNTVTPRPDTGAVDLRIPPSRTERNIVHMSRSLAHGGVALRKYDIDDEVDEPVSTLGSHMIDTYCTQATSRPIPQVPSDSLRVRNAVNRARTRNTLLGH